MSKKLTVAQIQDAARDAKIPYAALRAVIEIEASGNGFNPDGTPVILFERHVFWRRLGAIRWFTKRLEIMAKHPTVCNPVAGGYGGYNIQHKKLEIAASYNREEALQSCSWGLGQVMGYHWQSLGYPSLQAFINAMYANEAGQLDAMIRFIKKNGLLGYLQKQQWSSFARGYNGAGYKRNNYDVKLAAAYRKYL